MYVSYCTISAPLIYISTSLHISTLAILKLINLLTLIYLSTCRPLNIMMALDLVPRPVNTVVESSCQTELRDKYMSINSQCDLQSILETPH